MKTLKRTLQDQDPALWPVLAKRWGVAIQNLSKDEIVHTLNEAMLEKERVEAVWESLDDDQRGALQALLSASGKMPKNMFTRLFGEVRQMGADQIEREKPHLHPASSAEALYYRGLIAETFEQVEAGARPVMYVPTDLLAVLPSHKTAYENLEAPAAPPPGEAYEIEPLDEVEDIQQADTSVVDDLTTLLAYMQLHTVRLEGDRLPAADRDRLRDYLLARSDTRLDFLVGLALSADLLDVENGQAVPKRAEARRWLAQPRSAQVRSLADAWRESLLYRDLWHVPGLHPEPTGWPYDPVVARRAVIRFLGEIVPEQDWWSLDEFIEAIHSSEPDFQRPGGDYDSWYIRNDEGDYLRGFESWDAVEGALLEFYIQGPMHWLGLVDLAEDAARLTAYGRAFTDIIPWPTPPEPEDKMQVEDDGTLRISRRVSRIDRFQVARFTTWQPVSDDPFTYKLDATSIAQADKQGINSSQIGAFIQRALGENRPLPPRIRQLLETWQSGPSTSVTLERLLVLRTNAPETLTLLLENPALRRYLGAQLGPMAVIVRADQWEALREALGEKGIQMDVTGGLT